MTFDLSNEEAVLLLAALARVRRVDRSHTNALGKVHDRLDAQARMQDLRWEEYDDEIQIGLPPSLRSLSTLPESPPCPPPSLSSLPKSPSGGSHVQSALPVSSPCPAPSLPESPPGPPHTLSVLPESHLSPTGSPSHLRVPSSELFPNSLSSLRSGQKRSANGPKTPPSKRLRLEHRAVVEDDNPASADDLPKGEQRNANRPRRAEKSVAIRGDGLEEDEEFGEETVLQSTRRWTTKGEPPTLNKDTAKAILKLLTVTTGRANQRLTDLLKSLDFAPLPPATTLVSPQQETTSATFKTLADRCKLVENNAVTNSFHRMMSLVNLALYVDWHTKMYGVKTWLQWIKEAGDQSLLPGTLSSWFSAGSRLIYLAVAGTMYLLPLIAAAGMTNDINGVYLMSQIQVLAFNLCNPPKTNDNHPIGAHVGSIIRDTVIPHIARIHRLSSSLQENVLCITFPGEPLTTISFGDVDAMETRLRSFNANFFQLPKRDGAWNVLKLPLLSLPALPTHNVDETCVANVIDIETPLDLQKTKCPVTKSNRKEWTAAERVKAERATCPTSVTELKQTLDDLHFGGVRKQDSYVRIDTKLFQGQAAHIHDKNGKLLAFVATNLNLILPGLKDTLVHQLGSLLGREIYNDNSDRADFTFYSWHGAWYNRYAEQGHDAPKDVHPNYVRKTGVKHVNIDQRTPLPSREMREDPEEATLIGEILQPIVTLAEYYLRHYFPGQYEKIRIYASNLPLNDKSIAHPFGGLAINICVSTEGHRDEFDNLLCIVIPFGDYHGGELALFEPGFVLDLHALDMAVFPSCDITHFNLKFTGQRLSLVLHSDKYGDKWVYDGNGWF